MTKKFLALALGAVMALSTAADAATVTHEVVKQYAKYLGADGAPLVGDYGTVKQDHVVVKDNVVINRFYDELSFGNLVSGTVESISLTLFYSGASDQKIGFLFPQKEEWTVYGTTNGGLLPKDREELGTLSEPHLLTITLDRQLADAGLRSVFDHAVNTGTMGFWFGANGVWQANFNLKSATLLVTTSIAAVPVPAAGLLMIGALGGLAALRRRKAVAA